MREVLGFFANMAERKFHFLVFILVVGMAGILYAHGLTWTTFFFMLFAVFAIVCGWIVTSFWVALFRSWGQQQPQQRDKP